MPVRADLRKFYTAASGWPEVRRRTLTRAGGTFDPDGHYQGGARCENCGKPDRKRVWRLATPRGQVWQRVKSRRWYACYDHGRPVRPVPNPWMQKHPKCQKVLVVLTCAHKNHTSGDDRADNVFAWCQACHLAWDRPMHLARTRITVCNRKDAARPLLREMIV